MLLLIACMVLRLQISHFHFLTVLEQWYDYNWLPLCWTLFVCTDFTRMVLSLWAMTTLSLYIRVQVNILGRHLYIDTARGLGSSHLLVSFTASPPFITVEKNIYLVHSLILWVAVDWIRYWNSICTSLVVFIILSV